MCLCLTVIIIEEITNLEGKDTEEVGGGEGGHFVNKVLVYEILKSYKLLKIHILIRTVFLNALTF